MRAEDVRAVRDLHLFHHAREDTFDSLVGSGFLQRFPKGVALIRESDPADFLHVVVEGLVEMYATEGSRETAIDLVRPVGAFILAAVLSDQVYLQSARTLASSRILMIPAERVRAAMRSDAAFMAAVVVELARAYRTVVKDLKNHKLRAAAQRLANWLIRREVEQGGRGAVVLDIEKRTLASRLGMTPENLSRAFAALQPHGVKVAGACIAIARPADLARFATPNPLIDAPEPEPPELQIRRG